MPSLQQYIPIGQDAPHVERWTRRDESHWLLSEFNDLNQSFRLTSIDCVLSLSEVYDKVDWPA